MQQSSMEGERIEEEKEIPEDIKIELELRIKLH